MTKSLNHKIFPSTSCGIKMSDCMVKLCNIIEICRIIEVATSVKELQIFLAMTLQYYELHNIKILQIDVNQFIAAND